MFSVRGPLPPKNRFARVGCAARLVDLVVAMFRVVGMVRHRGNAVVKRRQSRIARSSDTDDVWGTISDKLSCLNSRTPGTETTDAGDSWAAGERQA